ncbi:hypothetical protein TNCV_1157781 [Trichonephila clavipes]|nr:hypothetical protein TNCV_1157781 [Trichonephila clavipes]
MRGGRPLTLPLGVLPQIWGGAELKRTVTFAEKIETLLNGRRANCKAKITKLQTFLNDKAPNARRLLIQSKLDNISEIFTNMETLRIEYYEFLKKKILPNLCVELTFDQMEEDLEST